MDTVDPGRLGGTYAGLPVASAAALAVLDVIEGENLLDRSATLGAHVTERLETFLRCDDLLPIDAAHAACPASAVRQR